MDTRTMKFSKSFLDKYPDYPKAWNTNPYAYFVFKRTYARVKENGSLESWKDTLVRCIEGAQSIGADYTQEEMEKLFDYMFNLKAIYSGRMLWRLGTQDKLSKYGDALNNCWSVSLDSVQAFCFLFEQLMLGGGVGYSIRRQDIAQLPKVKPTVTVKHEPTKDADFIVPDSREGWVRLLREVLTSFLHTGKSFTYSTILIRSAGTPIKGFGGVASGPNVLVDGITNICGILSSRSGKKLRSIDVLDIANIIGSIVVSGNVRRSAQIALGDADDILFLNAKRWDTGSIPNWRSYSNNTIYADTYAYLTPQFWEGYFGNGEPYGLFNLKLAQTNGRLGEYIEDNCEMLNPCGEQTLESYECCNLAEIPLNNVDSLEEFKEIATLLYKTQKAVAAMPYLYEETEKVVHKNMRLGLSITGITQSLDKLQWLDIVYTYLRRFDEAWSVKKGYPKSIKLTCVKPSGTVSLLTNSTPGVHPAFAEYYIRRVRIQSDHFLVDTARKHGYHVEYVRQFNGDLDYSTSIIEFPVHVPNAIYAKDMSAIDQLELVKTIQTLWADNAVSVTVYYKIEEIPLIQEWLKANYEQSVKSVSFLLHTGHNFAQAPYEEITQEDYEKRSKSFIPIVAEVGSIVEEECATGACPIR